MLAKSPVLLRVRSATFARRLHGREMANPVRGTRLFRSMPVASK